MSAKLRFFSDICNKSFTFSNNRKQKAFSVLRIKYIVYSIQLFDNVHQSVMGGAGGIRTLVQTGKPYAFYMLISAFNFRA